MDRVTYAVDRALRLASKSQPVLWPHVDGSQQAALRCRGPQRSRPDARTPRPPRRSSRNATQPHSGSPVTLVRWTTAAGSSSVYGNSQTAQMTTFPGYVHSIGVPHNSDGWMGLPAGVTHLVGRLIGMSNLESSNLVARPEVASHRRDSEDRSWLDEDSRSTASCSHISTSIDSAFARFRGRAQPRCTTRGRMVR